MLYLLHHKKGALVLSASDRDQVARWSERQLGKEAGLVSITEEFRKDTESFVEKDGTGIGTASDNGCRPVIGVLANLAQDVHGEQGRSESQTTLPAGLTPSARKPTWH